MPMGVAVTHDGTKAYVVGGSGVITVVNTGTNEIIRTISAGAHPYYLTISQDGTKVYVADYAGDRVYFIDTATDVVSSIPVGDGPGDMVISPDGTRVYVANQGDGTISIINTEYGLETFEYLTTTVTLGITPNSLAITPDGNKIFVVDYRGLIQIFDRLSCTVSDPIWVGGNPVDIAITLDGTKAYLVQPDLNSVEVLDTASFTSLRSIPVGVDPYMMAITPDGTRAYVTNRISGSVSVISTGSDDVVGTILIAAPWSPYATPAGLWISRGIPEVTLTSSPSSSVYGQAVEYTATVAGTGITPTGMVIFKDGRTAIGGNFVNGAGESTWIARALPAGTRQITALYQGDSLYGTATSPAFTQTVDRADTVMALTSSSNPTVYGQPVTFTAAVSTVTPVDRAPTGTVTFLVDGTPTEPVSYSGYAVTYTTSSLSAGSHTITATYADVEGNYNDCTGSLTGGPQIVDKADTATELTEDINPTIYGQPVTFTATISTIAPGAGVPTGTVTFLDGGSTVGTATLSATGVATLATSALTAGAHTITATYSGDSNFNTCAGPLPGDQVVNRADTTQTLTSSLNPSIYGQPITYTATVSATTSDSGTPTGTVTFLDGGSTMGTATLSGGVATLTTAGLSGGSHSIAATYAGDSNFHGCAGSMIGNPQVVSQDSTATTLVASPSPGRIGHPVAFTATVTGTYGTPTGTVTFLDGGSSLGTATISGGTATFTTSGLSLGEHTVTAAYAGDTNYLSSTSSELSEIILENPPVADFTVNVSSGVSPVTIGFTDTSLGSPTSWAWNFGDGTADSTEQNPVHSYSRAGTYTVTLTVTNAGGSATLQRSSLITVRDPARGMPPTISMDQMYFRQTGLFTPSPSPLPSSTPIPVPAAQTVAGASAIPTAMSSSLATPAATPDATTGSPARIPILLVLGLIVAVTVATGVIYVWVIRK